MSLRARLTLFIALAVALALLAQGALGYLDFRTTVLHDVDRDARQEAERLARRLSPGSGDEHPAPDDGSAPVPARVLRGGRVLRALGGPFPAGAQLGDWRLARVALTGWGEGAVLEVAVPMREYQRGLRAYQQTVAVTTTALALLGAVVAWLLSRGALRPLEGLIGVTERVAASGDLRTRVPEVGAGELARLGASFNVMMARLEGFRQREAEFTRHASHELRTPLAAMKAQLDANHAGWVTDAEALAAARAQVERMTRLTEALLLLAREDRVEVQAFDLAGLVAATAAQHGAPYSGPAALPFRGDPALLARALENLLENVGRYAPGAPVAVRLELESGQVALSVEDRGPGVPEDAAARLGEAFYRVPGTRSAGSGLGLAVVRRVAQVHGGEARTRPAAPHGLTVTLVLPYPLPEA